MDEEAIAPVDILLVEDNNADVELTRQALREARIPNHLHVAEDGEDAMQFLHREAPHEKAPRPDLIILDLNLPSKNGREVLQEVKGDDDLKSIPVVVLTTSEDAEDIRDVYRHHGNSYLCKPVDFHDFLKIIKTFESFWLGAAKLPPREAGGS